MLNVLIGPIGLAIRLVFFNIAGALAYLGWLELDQTTNVVTIDLSALANWTAAIVINALVFSWSRIAKKLQGVT